MIDRVQIIQVDHQLQIWPDLLAVKIFLSIPLRVKKLLEGQMHYTYTDYIYHVTKLGFFKNLANLVMYEY